MDICSMFTALRLSKPFSRPFPGMLIVAGKHSSARHLSTIRHSRARRTVYLPPISSKIYKYNNFMNISLPPTSQHIWGSLASLLNSKCAPPSLSDNHCIFTKVKICSVIEKGLSQDLTTEGQFVPMAQILGNILFLGGQTN